MPILIDGKKPDENEVDDLLEELGISHCKNKFPSQMSDCASGLPWITSVQLFPHFLR